MRPYRRFPIEDVSQVGEARRATQALATEQGFDEDAAGRLALIVTELGTNLHRHVGPNRQAALLLGLAQGEIEILSLDQGPGMDVQRCLRDGYTTAGSSGTGLGAVRRMATRFGAFSAPGRGTVIAVRVSPRLERHAATPAPAPFDLAGISLAAPGELVSGDAWTVRAMPEHWLVLLADGLGHGVAAAEAADRLVHLMQQAPMSQTSPAALLQDAHEPMRMTRGAAVSMARLDVAHPSFVFSGAGNVTGRLLSGVADRSLLAQHGTLGLQVRRLQDIPYDWPPHALLILHSDGIQTRWKLDDTPALLQADPAVIAGWILRDHCRGRDDATVVVIRRSLS